MKLRMTWDTNPDGAQRVLMQAGRVLRFWVLVKDEGDEPVGEGCELSARILETGLLRWLHRIGPWWRRTPRAVRRRVEVRRVNAERAEFLVTAVPRRFLPYWVQLRAVKSAAENERARLFVVPRANRFLSLLFVVAFGTLVSYASWLWLSVASESLPDGVVTIAATASAVLAPFAALISPLVSATVRRFALDSLVSGGAAVVAMLGVVVLYRYQDPVFLENHTPAEISAAGVRGKQVVVPAGEALAVPAAHLDSTWLEAMRKRRPSLLPREHWFNSGQYCLLTDAPSVREPGSETGHECLEFQSPGLKAKLQRWLSLREGIRIGCESDAGLDPDAIEAWKGSKSCRHNPELEVKRTLRYHRLLTKSGSSDAPAACEANGGVTVRPFVTAPNRKDTSSPSQLQTLALSMPDSALPGESLPSWTFKGDGHLAEVRMTPSTNGTGEPCAMPYPTPCRDRTRHCSGLFVPPGALTAAISLGEQKLGKLTCPNPPGRVFMARLRSRIVALTVLERVEQDEKTFVRQVSRYETEPSELPSAWVFWCEPEPDVEKYASASAAPPLSAEVMLQRDWQPVEEWKVGVPRESRITSLEFSVQDRGRWGTLVCHERSSERWLGLKELADAHNVRLQSAVEPHTADWGRASGWHGYGESTLFPRWVWRCEDERGRVLHDKLSAKLEDGTRGTLTQAGSFAPSPGAPCVINPITGDRAPGSASKGAPSATDLLKKFGVPGCDPNRSVLALAQGEK